METGLKHAAKLPNHNIEDVYAVRKVNILKYSCFLDKSISMELLGFRVFEIVGKHALADALRGQTRVFPGYLTRTEPEALKMQVCDGSSTCKECTTQATCREASHGTPKCKLYAFEFMNLSLAL